MQPQHFHVSAYEKLAAKKFCLTVGNMYLAAFFLFFLFSFPHCLIFNELVKYYTLHAYSMPCATE